MEEVMKMVEDFVDCVLIVNFMNFCIVYGKGNGVFCKVVR